MQVSEPFDEAVAEFMAESGAPLQYVKRTSVYDFATGGTTDTEVIFESVGIMVDLTLQSNGYSVKYGTMVQAGDKEIYMRPPSRIDSGNDDPEIDPQKDRVVFAGVTYTVVTFKEINPDGVTPLVYMLYVRR